MNAKELNNIAGQLFSKRMPLVSLWQEVADNFYPERADFTLKRSIGTDFAANLMSSYPVMCRRDLGNQFGTMLRPTAKPWFHLKRRFIEEEKTEVRRVLEQFAGTMRNAMYDPISMFTRATKEGDHDFAAFGQCVISVEVGNNSRHGQHLLYRCWHLRDVAWQEDELGQIGYVFRKWKPTVDTAVRTFGEDKVNKKWNELHQKDPFAEVECVHMVVTADAYDKDTKCPRWSIWYDTQNDHVIEETPIWGRYYIIPRWQTVSNSQYSYSPATVAALPDSRLIQAMTFTLLEAGEKATSPPMVATVDAVRSDVNLFAGGITWVDQEYDERLGEALRPITQDFRGFNFGVQMNADTRAMIREAFYLNTLSFPQRTQEMTAYEVGQRVQEYIRNALPIFEPLESEYNFNLCDETFELMWRNNAFGSPEAWPKELSGAEIDFTFESPLHDAIGEQKGHKILEAAQLLGQAVALDPGSAFLLDAKVALRDALDGIQTPAKWMRSEDEVSKLERSQAQAMAQQQQLANMETASKSAQNIASAQADRAGAGMPVPGQPQPMAV